MLATGDLVESIKLSSNKHGVIAKDFHKNLEFIGAGRSAAVFRVKNSNKALKVFLPAFKYLAKEEAEIYALLQGIDYYPVVYEIGGNFILMDFIEGDTLFNCLVKGKLIMPSFIKEIDHALHLARSKALNPSDIHLRNILITPDQQVKLIDVARFRQTKSCHQWDDLKEAYYTYYQHDWFPKRIPVKILNTLAYLYNHNILHFFISRKPRKDDVA